MLRCGGAAALWIAVSAGLASAQADCRRPAARQFREGEVVVISEAKKFPCKFEFATTTIALRADADTAIRDLGRMVARGPDGSLYTSSGGGSEMHVWSPTGQLKRVFGNQGSGPGEFARGMQVFAFGRDGRIFISDGPPNRRWSVFSPALVFERTIAATPTGLGNNQDGFLTSEGLYVSSAMSVTLTGNAIATFDFARPLVDGQPRVVHQFAKPIAQTPRIVTPSLGQTFWSATREGPAASYDIELWRTDGTLLRTIRRDVPWFPKDADRASEMEVFSDDGTGIILVGLMIPDAAKLRAIPRELDREKRRALQEGAIDIYYEAIDGNAGVVLASWGPFPPSVALKTVPTGMIPLSRTGYRFETDADGFSIARILDVKLRAN